MASPSHPRTLPPLRFAEENSMDDEREILNALPPISTRPSLSPQSQAEPLPEELTAVTESPSAFAGQDIPAIKIVTGAPVNSAYLQSEPTTTNAAFTPATAVSPAFGQLYPPKNFSSPAPSPVSPNIPPDYTQRKQVRPKKFEIWFRWLAKNIFATHEYSRPDAKVGPSETSDSKPTLDWKQLDEPKKDATSKEQDLNAEFSLHEYFTPFLRFKSSDLEEEYIYKVILPMLVLSIRFGSVAIGIYLLIELSFWSRPKYYSTQPIVVLALGFCVCSLSFFLTTWKRGKLFVEGYSRSYFIRVLLTILEGAMTSGCMIFDFIRFCEKPGDLVGSAANVLVIYIFLTSGFSGIFLSRCLNVFAILLIVAAKAYLIYVQASDDWHGSGNILVYALPVLASFLLCVDVAYFGDKDRRMKLLNTKIINARLKELQEGSKKTEYLLSLTLPPMIVSKLKEVGTGNFDLIAERFDLTSVMFTDIKNFKEIAHSISTRHGVNLLNTIFHHMDEVRTKFRNLERIKTINSKMLLVGGLDKDDKIDHLLELIDLALVFRDMFKEEVLYHIGGENGQESLSLKLQIAMGISIGPLVAGIVGKKTFCYEVYGDVVNTASRMLAIASGGQIVVTSQVWDLVSAEYSGRLIGERVVKGKGTMRVFSVESSKISEAVGRYQSAQSPIGPNAFSRGSGSIESISAGNKIDIPDENSENPDDYLRRLSRAAQKSSRPSFGIVRGSRNINKKILNDVVTAATTSKSYVPNLSEEDLDSRTEIRASTVHRQSDAPFPFPTRKSTRKASKPLESSLEDPYGSSEDFSNMTDVRTVLPNRISVARRESNPAVRSSFTKRTTRKQRRASTKPSFEPYVQEHPFIITLESDGDDKKDAESQKIGDDAKAQNLIENVGQSRRNSGLSIALLGGTPNTQRRWSKLIFTHETNLGANSRHGSHINLNRTAEKAAVGDASHQSQEIVKRIESFPTLHSTRIYNGVDSWKNEDSPLSLEELNTVEHVNANESAKDIIANLSATSLNRPSDTQNHLLDVKSRVSEVSQMEEAKYILLQTALANVGGYREQFTDADRAILEHTGTLKFLMNDHCMQLVLHSLTPFLKFSSTDLEKRYIADTNEKMGQSFWNFSVKGMICEIILISVVMISLYIIEDSTLEATNAAVPLIIIVFLLLGSQFMITAVTTVPSRSLLGPSTMLILGIWSVITFMGIVIIAGLWFIGLSDVPLLLTLAFSQLPLTHTFLLDGITFINKLLINFSVSIVFLLLHLPLQFSYGPFLMMFPYMAIFYMKETTMKSDYLMQLITVTQSNLVREESEKSKKVLTTILPKRIIIKLIEDTDTMFYEEFNMVTVLHMDIAGFTAMSAQLEPLDIVKIFNNLFTYFDSLVEDFRLEKITTIGDAYVASSNLSTNAQDARTSAISVCIVALRMQHFVVNQINESYVMKNKHKQVISMRIGINSGPCYGAIMGGDKNFRYDLMGDTVTNAEKVQEHCELAEVYIAEPTYNMVENYHAFNTELRDFRVAGQKVYALKMQQM